MNKYYLFPWHTNMIFVLFFSIFQYLPVCAGLTCSCSMTFKSWFRLSHVETCPCLEGLSRIVEERLCISLNLKCFCYGQRYELIAAIT